MKKILNLSLQNSQYAEMVKSFFQNFFRSELKVSFLLLIITILSYWQISLLQYSVHYDMLDVILPWRYHIGECLRHDCFPFWNPYQSTGYPIHADLQCPTWYPETLLIGSTFGYTNISLHILFTLYVFISGLGIFRLMKHFGAANFPAFITGAAFMLTGPFISHAQHLFAIVSLAWIPWVLMYYLKMNENPLNIRHILFFCLFSFLMISGGYQALTIIMFYLLLVLFIYYLIFSLLNKNYKNLYKIIASNICAFLIILALSAVIIISVLGVKDYASRLGGITLESAMANPFPPQALISLIIPYGIQGNHDFFRTDISMRNIYTGLFLMVFCITGLLYKQKPIIKILLIFGLFSLLASFGQYLPVREFLYKYVPLMNLFRFPAYFNFFAVIPVVLAAGVTITGFLDEPERYRKILITVLTISGLVLFALLIWSGVSLVSGNPVGYPDGHKTHAPGLISDYRYIFIHSAIQLILTILFLAVFLLRMIRLPVLLSLFILVEMFISVQLNMFYTGCSKTWSPLQILSDLNERPQGFPLPPSGNISGNTDIKAAFMPVWRNTNIFNKTVSFDCFTSFKFNGYKHLEDSAKDLKNAILNNPLVYLSDEVYPVSESLSPEGPVSDHKAIFLQENDYKTIENTHLRSHKGDTAYITGFSPNKISVHANTSEGQLLTLLQSDYKGWKAIIDRESVPHYTSNHLYMSVYVPPGKHEIIFSYSNNPVKAAFILSYSILIFIVLFLVREYFKEKYPSNRFLLSFLAIIVIMIIVSVKFINISRQNIAGRLYKKYVDESLRLEKLSAEPLKTFFMVDNPYLLQDIINESDVTFSYTCYHHASRANLSRLYSDLHNYPEKNIQFALIGTMKYPEIIYILKKEYPEVKSFKSTRNSFYIQLQRNGEMLPGSLYSSLNDFEGASAGWNGNPAFLDSTCSYSGKFSNKLDSANIYSYTFYAPYNMISKKRNVIFNISTAIMQTAGADATMVFQIMRDGKLIRQFSNGINEAIHENKTWSKVFLSRHIRYRLRPDDDIKIYIWNSGKGTIWVDDFRIELESGKTTE